MPIVLQTLNLPPTQSQNSKTLSSMIPKFLVKARLVDDAANWQATIFFFMSSVSGWFWFNLVYSWNSHSLILLAFRMVSAVVKVLEFTMTMVSSQFRPSVALDRSCGSTLAKNFSFLPLAASSQGVYCLMASCTNSMLR